MKDFKESVILFVEDDIEIANELQEILQMRYPVVVSAYNGKEGLSALEIHKPNLVITDIQMPVMDGLEMIEAIRKDHPKLPIIITSAYSDTQYLMRAIEMGVDHYVTKPVNPRKLIEEIDKVLQEQAKEQQLQEQSRMISQMMDLSPNPIFSIQDGKVDFANTAFLRLMRAKELQDLRPNFIERFICQIHPKERFTSIELWEKHVFENSSSTHNIQIRNDGDFNESNTYKLDSLHSSALSRSIFSLTDVTDLENARKLMAQKVQITQEELERQKKILEIQSRLAQMGEMIGAIAHQWKQPLTILGMTLDVMSDDIEEIAPGKDAHLQEQIAMLQDNLQYMNTTIRDFKDFFSPTKIPKIFTLKDCIGSIITMIGRQYKQNSITIEILGDVEIPILGYPNEFKQALINLINNAKDAFIERDIKERKITILSKASPKEEQIHISIEDSAGGILEDALPHIFEPYFTTKGDKGTGIGLQLAKMIIEESMQGSITVYNGKLGACFEIVLPIKKDNL